MVIPSRKDIEAKQTQGPASGLKEQLEQATKDALKQLTAVLNNSESSGADKVSAAMKIIQIAHGKDGLRLEEEKTDAAKELVAALRALRFPTPPDDVLNRFIEYEGILERPNYEEITHLLRQYTKAIKAPDEYFASDETSAPNPDG